MMPPEHKTISHRTDKGLTVVVVGQLWRSKKTRNIYKVVDFALNCTNEQNGQEMVAYVNIDDKDDLYVRESHEFIEKFEEV